MKIVPLTILCALTVTLCGCEKIADANSSRAFDRGQQDAAAGHYQAAICDYEAALDGTPKTADIHYRMALIFDDKLNQPDAAAYHYARYIALAPNGEYAREAQSLLKQDQFKLVNILSSGSFLTQRDAAHLKNENLALAKKVAEQAAFIKTLQAALPRSVADSEIKRKPIPENARIYIVRRGDTFASIARKFYQNPHRWQKIQNANFDTLGSGPVPLKPGMQLYIP